MAAPDFGPFADYTGLAAGAGVTKASVNAALDNLTALIPAEVTDPTAVQSPPASPAFGEIPMRTAELLRAEIAALQAAITAAA